MKKVLVLFLVLVISSAFLFAGGGAQRGAVNEHGMQRVRITQANVVIGREGWDYTNGDAFASWWSNRFNYDLEVTTLTFDNWTQNLRLWVTTGDMPDVATFDYTSNNHPDAAMFVEQGLIKRFPDNWKQRWPNIAAIYEVTSLGPHLEQLYGGTYFIPRARFQRNIPGDPLPNHWAMHMRRDWIQAVGMPLKTHYTLTEVMDYLRRVRDQDPGRVGARLVPFAATPRTAAMFFLQSNSTHWDTFFLDTDGIYKWGAATNDTLEGLKLWYEAYSTGLMDPEFFLLGIDQDRAQFNTPPVAGMFFEGGPTGALQSARQTFVVNNPGTNADEMYHFATALGINGYYHQRDLINFWGTIMFNPRVSDAVFERWMDVMDFASTDEGFVITNMGLPEIDFTVRNGEYVSLLPPGTILSGAPGVGKYSSMGYIIGSVKLFDDFNFDNPNIAQRYREESWTLYTERSRMSTPLTFPKVDWDLWTYDSPNMRRARFNYSTDFANMVINATSASHLEVLFRNWVNEQNHLVQPVLNELNARRR